MQATVAGSSPNLLNSATSSALSVDTPLRASRMTARFSGFTSGVPTTSGSNDLTTPPEELRTSFSRCGFMRLPVAMAP